MKQTFSFLKYALAAAVLLCVAMPAAAQTATVTGTVRDQQDVIIGASVTLAGNKSVGTVTDVNGAFSLRVPDGTKALVVTSLGYDPQTVALGGRTNITVTLHESSQVLDEVVSIGYAKVRRKDLTGATSSVSGSELASVPAMTAAQALQGKAAGVNIVTSSGAPGAGANVTIRGGMSITQSTKPLYIVDGFEMSDALDKIDVNDIESIDVLKDASSTAIYGARGSNGIILITTKSAKEGKTQISYNTFFSIDQIAKKLDMMDNAEAYVKYQYEFAAMQNLAGGWASVFDANHATDAADFASGAYARIAQRYAGLGGLDWQDEVFGGTALTQSHNVNISTGTEKTRVLLSYNYNGQDGLLSNHSSRRSAFRTKINTELYKGVRLDVNAMFSNKNTKGGGSYSGMKNVLLQPITGGTLFTDDEMLHTQTYPSFSSLHSSFDTANPLVQNDAVTSQKRSRMYSVNAGIEADFLKHFTWRTAGSYTWTSDKSDSFSDENSTSYLMDPVNTGITGSIGNSEGYKWQITNTLTYNQTFAKHKVGGLLGHEVTYSESEGNSLSLIKFPYPNFGLDNIKNATVSDKGTSHSRSGVVSLFARLNYNYDERYLLTATLRADGCTKFAKENRWGYFPSASAAWRISEEKFFKDSKAADVINSLKLRVGYGTTGNSSIGDYLYTTPINETNYPMNNNPGELAYVLDTNLGNKDLKWETLTSTNIGLDISLFNSRINLTAEWYNNEVSDMLMKCVIPVTTGYKTQYQNIGKMRNRGFEFTLNTVNVRTKSFRWTSDLNISLNRSKVIELEANQDSKIFTVGSNRSGSVDYYATVGERLGDMYGYRYDGVYTTADFTQDAATGKLSLREGVTVPLDAKGKALAVQPGDIKFAANQTADDGTPQFSYGHREKIGNGTPTCVGGFNNTFQYRGFDLSVFMKFALGYDIYNATKHSMSPYAQFQNVPKEFGDNYYRLIDPATGVKATTLDAIHALNPDEGSRLWNLGTTNSNYITYPSSYYVEDGSYLRIAQVTLGYTFPKRWMSKLMIQNLRVYFTANNLATITGYSGYDPEVTSGNDNVACTQGYDSSMYPRSRSWVLGLNVTF